MQRPLPQAFQAVADLETRQDEVLAQLDELEERVEAALRLFGAVVKPGTDGRATIEFPADDSTLRRAG